MPIINDCEIWFPKLNPARPNATFNKKNPTWELQLRTTSKAQKKLWEEAGLSVKAVVPDEGETYFRVNLKKKSIKENGEPSSIVKVVDGNMKPIDPNTIGNGSTANIRVFQYEYTNDGKTGLATVLMGVQLTNHIVYEPKAREDEFGITTTTTVVPDADAAEEADVPY